MKARRIGQPAIYTSRLMLFGRLFTNLLGGIGLKREPQKGRACLDSSKFGYYDQIGQCKQYRIHYDIERHISLNAFIGLSHPQNGIEKYLSSEMPPFLQVVHSN